MVTLVKVIHAHTPVPLSYHAWRKYKDATLLNEFHEMEMSHDVDTDHRDTEQLIDDNGAAAASPGNVNYDGVSSDEEEIDTGNYRP